MLVASALLHSAGRAWELMAAAICASSSSLVAAPAASAGRRQGAGRIPAVKASFFFGRALRYTKLSTSHSGPASHSWYVHAELKDGRGAVLGFAGGQPIFPRIHVRDPYKRLGLSLDASEEEVREAHTYLSAEYAAHERSREAIEDAYDQIIMESFRERKKTKINLKSTLKKKVSESPPWVQAFFRMVEVPKQEIIVRRAVLYALLGVWSVFNPAEGGPAFQVAVSLGLCIYFLNDRLKSIGRATMLGFSALAVGWMCGSFLVPLIPSSFYLTTQLTAYFSLELMTALITYVFLFLACTFLK